MTTAAAFIALGICLAGAASPAAAQLAMGRSEPRKVPAAKKPTGAPPGSRSRSGSAAEDKRLVEAINRLSPKDRKKLAKAMKHMTPEERRQVFEGAKRQLAGR